jgi:hypothetical protein
MLKQYTGFKGICAFAQLGEIQFVIVATNQRQLQTLWDNIMTEAGPLDPAGCKKAVLVEAELLGQKAIAKIDPKPISKDLPTIDV